MGLIEQLHREHKEIRLHLKKIQVNDDIEILNQHFSELKRVLISHLITEDNELYPALRSLQVTEKISNSFEEEMGRISSDIMDFYAKYKYEFKGENFRGDVSMIIESLIYRITKEERELYPTFQEHFPNK